MSELEGIAIIGLQGRFPGANNVEEFWQNLAAGRDTISFFTDDEITRAGLDVRALQDAGTYVPARGVMRDAECFDRAFFGIHPKEAEVMDPQHRVFLEGCWEALERSGYAPGRIDVPVGIYCGATFNTYYQHAIGNRPDLIDLVGSDQVMFGNEKDYIATRTAYKLNLRGPAISLNTACSSSLTAICQACQSLLMFQCDMAVAGGVSVTVPQSRGYHFQEGNIASPDGHTRTFDADAKGTAFSNGMALLVLKRVDEAINDGDQIYGVIKGFALNNDGADRVSFGAPGVDGQAEVISLAQEMAEADPDEISYVEAHGTATPVGDPIEVAALTEAFRRSTSRKQFCCIGSVKSNVGHLDAASGAAGLIKTALALHHGKIPANPHFTRPNPKLDLENSPFYVNTELQPWDRQGDRRRLAGVSSFGTGGTNAHVVVEEAPVPEPSGPSRSEQLLPLSAKTPEALDRMRANLANHLRSCPDANLADVAFTLQTGRSEFVHRHAVVCNSTGQACSLLESPTPQRVFSARQEHKDPPVVFMFPGQGAQFAGMGADLYESEDVFRDVVDRCAETLRPILNEDLREVLFPGPENKEEATEKIRQTRFTQPALFVIEYALARLWMSWGIEPTAMIGHSVGEFVAACLADVMKLDDALHLIARRAELVQSMPPGSMLAVRLPEAEILPQLTPSLAVAAVNSPALCVVAGPDESIEAFDQQLSDRGVFTKRLRTSHAFHSQMMDPVIEPFTEVLRRVEFSEPKIPYVSNVTAEWIESDHAKSPEYWASHVRDAVRFADGVEKLLQDPSHVLLEVGPGRGLTQLAMQHPSRDKSQRVVTSMPYTEGEDAPGVIGALGALWTAGVNVDWQAFYAGETRRRVVLPSYPFERTVCWPSTPATASQQAPVEPAETLVQPSAPVETNNPVVPPTPAIVSPVENLEPVDAPETPSVPDVPRKQRLVGEICAVLEELSGASISAADTSVNLLEFGFDSLLLTQVATLLRKKFRTKVTFRQLMEELSTIDAIATYVDANLPPEPQRKPPPSAAAAPAVTEPRSSATATTSHSATSVHRQSADGQNLEAQLEQHLAASADLLHRIRQRPVSGSAVGPDTEPRSGIAIGPASVDALTAVAPRATHGPFKSLDASKVVELTDSQQKKLDEFIARYTRRTATSKKLAAQNRSILADPRSVAGFKTAWKEAVYPLHTIRSEGSKIWDVDGNEYVDFVMGFGASLFGHRPPFVVEAVKAQLDAGFETGPIHPMAGEVARLVQELTGAERVAFCSTGSEGVLAAIRVARTVTARDKIVIFEGAYHGIFDEVLARPLIRNGELRSMPTAPGIPDGTFGEIIVLQYGNPASLEMIEQYGDDIAAVLVEPIQARRLDLVPGEFLHQLREITATTGTALVFDEVVTGFRLQPGGAQAYFGIKADLATYGKVVGGGLPIGIVTGKPMYMDALDGGPWQFGDDSAPEVGVTFFAGTFVRHPLALAAAKSVLTHLKQEGPELQVKVAEKGARVAKAFRELFDRYNAPYHLCNFSSLVYVSVPPEFTYGPLLFCHMRDRGIHIFENRLFVLTTSHTDDDIERLIDAMDDSLKEMQQGGFLPDANESRNLVTESTRRALPPVRPETKPAAAETVSDFHRQPPGPVNVDRCSTLEEIQDQGDRIPLFCMPAADGLTLVYHELADRLGPNQPVYGLNSPGAIGEKVPHTFEEMATRFVEDIREVCPHGPYAIVGYCSGGSVALEVAQQLVAAGEKVAMVCGIETYDWSTCPAARPRLSVKLVYEVERLYFHARDFLSLDLDNKRSFLTSKLNRLRSRLRVWRGMFSSMIRGKKRKVTSKTDWNDLWRQHDEISVRYFPKPYPGKLLLIRPRTDYRSYVGEKELEALGGVNIVRLSAFPACLMTPPHVDQVAELIASSIDEGLRECGIDPTTLRHESNPKNDAVNDVASIENERVTRQGTGV